jgi:hypothetical protein
MSRPPLFIHIPKTGGTSIQESGLVSTTSYTGLKPELIKLLELDLGPFSNGLIFGSTQQKHLPYNHLSLEYLNQFDRKFSVVRNPWARLVSWYNFADNISEIYRKYNKPWVQSKITWEEYLNHMETFDMTHNFYWKHPYDNWATQSTWVDTNKVDFLRQEHLQEDLSKYLGKEIELPVSNQSKAVDYRTYYTEEQKQKVAEWFKVDIDYWGFDFDSPATRNIWVL